MLNKLKKTLVANLILLFGASGVLSADRNSRSQDDDLGDADILSRSETPAFSTFNNALGVPLLGNKGSDVVCVDASNAAEMQKKMPRLFKDFNLLARLPLTGKAVHTAVMDSKNSFVTCTLDIVPGQSSTSMYSAKRITISSNNGTEVTFHEALHAAQDVDGELKRRFTLTQKDAAVAIFLQEAVAVAYELATRQEAKNQRVALVENTVLGAANHPDNEDAFSSAYNKAWKANKGMEMKARETKALEAGGKAVVSRLMDGKYVVWGISYTTQAMRTIKSAGPFFCDDRRELADGYAEMRRSFYAHLGSVSPEINFTPDEFLGADANQHIDKSFERVNIDEIRLPMLAKTCTAAVTGLRK